MRQSLKGTLNFITDELILGQGNLFQITKRLSRLTTTLTVCGADLFQIKNYVDTENSGFAKDAADLAAFNKTIQVKMNHERLRRSSCTLWDFRLGIYR